MENKNLKLDPTNTKKQFTWNVFWLLFLPLLFSAPYSLLGQMPPGPPPPSPPPPPTQSIPPPPPAPLSFSHNLTEKLFNRGKTKIEYKSNGIGLKIEYEGDITLSDDESDIIGLTNNGYFYIQKSAFGSKRKIKIETDRQGNLIKEYYVGRRKKDYIPEGKAWLEEILPEVLRSTTIAAPHRVNKLYNQGGVKKVIAEIEEMDSDHAASTYYQLLLNKDIQNQEYSDIVRSAGKVIDSDHYLAEVLMDNHMACFSEPSMIDAFIEASGEIRSDHYMTEVMKKVIYNADVTDAQVAALLSISKDISSDHYLSVVLMDVLDVRDMTDTNIASIIELSHDISSDHYKSEVLKAVLSKEGLSKEAMNSFVESISDISSDHFVTEVILHLSKNSLDDQSLAELIDILSHNVSSDHYMAESLKIIIYRNKLDDDSFTALTKAMNRINSDHYLIEVFEMTARKRNLTERQVIQLIETFYEVNSDSYLSDGLIEISDYVLKYGSKAITAYKAAAREINSKTYYGRAMKALD